MEGRLGASSTHMMCPVVEEDVRTGAEGTEGYPPPGHDEEDVGLQLLTRRLQLLTTQRQVAARHCEKFVRFLEQATEGGWETKESACQPGRGSGEGGEECSLQGVKPVGNLMKSMTLNAKHRRQASCPDVTAPALKSAAKGSRDSRQGELNWHRRQSSCPEEPLPTAHELLSVLERGGDIVGADVGPLTSAKSPPLGHIVVAPPRTDRLVQEELLSKLPKSTSMSKHWRHRRSCSLETYDVAAESQHADVAGAPEKGLSRKITLGKDTPADPFADVALEWEVVGTKPAKPDEHDKGKGTRHRRQKSLAAAGELPFQERRSPPQDGHNSPSSRTASCASPSNQRSFPGASRGLPQLNRSPPMALKLNPRHGSINLSPSHSLTDLTWQGPDSSAPRQQPRRPAFSSQNRSLPPLSPAMSWTAPPPQTAKSAGQLASNRVFLPPRPLVEESEVSPCSPSVLSSVWPSPDGASLVQPQVSLTPPRHSYHPPALQISCARGSMNHQQFYSEQSYPPHEVNRHHRGRPPPLLVDCDVSPRKGVSEWNPQVYAAAQPNSVHVSNPSHQSVTPTGGVRSPFPKEHRLRHQPSAPLTNSQYALSLPRTSTSPYTKHPEASDQLSSQERLGVNHMQIGGLADACMGPLSPSSESSEVLTSPSTPPVPRSTSTPVWGVPQKDKATNRRQGAGPSLRGKMGGVSPEPPFIAHSLSQPPANSAAQCQVGPTGYMNSAVARSASAQSPSLAGPPRSSPGLPPAYSHSLYAGKAGSRGFLGWQVKGGESMLGSFSSVGQESLESFPSGSSFLPSPSSREVTPPKYYGFGQAQRM